MWEGVKKRAKENGVPFNLTLQDIPEIPDACPILGILLCSNTKSGPLDSSPSLDRIHPVLGYIVGNVRVISNRANRLRIDATGRELRALSNDADRIESEVYTCTKVNR